MYNRNIEAPFRELLAKHQSAILFGPRQVGKTTLIKGLLKDLPDVVSYPLQDPQVRIALERDPSLIIRQLQTAKRKNYVFVDEAQKVPALFDAVQYAIDEKLSAFILTGSSARKLRRKGANLLPGRVKMFRMDPLLWNEFGWVRDNVCQSLILKNISAAMAQYSFHESLVFGALPGIVSLPEKDRKEFLKAYALTYVEEEIRAESLSRKIGAFSVFLELAAQESGTSPNISKLSMQAGVSMPALKEFFQILEDTLIIERVTPYIKNARKRILSSPRYYFFDIGVRNALGRLPLEPELVNAQKGRLFEHAVMLEIIRRIRALNLPYTVHFWRTAAGAEVDCVIDMGNEVIPVEIKAGEKVGRGDLRGLTDFLKTYPKLAKRGYVVTQMKASEQIAENITAVPWNEF